MGTVSTEKYTRNGSIISTGNISTVSTMGVSYKKSMKFWDKLDATSCYYAVAALVSRDHPKAGNGQSDQLLKFQVTFLFVCWEWYMMRNDILIQVIIHHISFWVIILIAWEWHHISLDPTISLLEHPQFSLFESHTIFVGKIMTYIVHITLIYHWAGVLSNKAAYPVDCVYIYPQHIGSVLVSNQLTKGLTYSL